MCRRGAAVDPAAAAPYCGVFVCYAVSLVCGRACAPTPFGKRGAPVPLPWTRLCAWKRSARAGIVCFGPRCLQCARSGHLSLGTVWRLVYIATEVQCFEAPAEC